MSKKVEVDQKFIIKLAKKVSEQGSELRTLQQEITTLYEILHAMSHELEDHPIVSFKVPITARDKDARVMNFTREVARLMQKYDIREVENLTISKHAAEG